MRAVAQLQPDLARVLDDLEARGIIPPETETATDSGEPMAREEAVVDAMLDLAQEKATEAAQTLQPEIAATAAGVTATARARTGVDQRQRLQPLPQVEMPALDLGLPSTAEFLDAEAERRAQLAEHAESMINRIRARVDQAADRVVGERVVPASPQPALSTQPAPTAPAARPIESSAEPLAGSSASTRLTQLVRDTPVLEPDAGVPTPSAADLATVADNLGLPLVELQTDVGAREFYGGLRRAGRSIVPEAGRFPTAVSAPNLVIVRGRLYPQAIARLREGYCDIPGTRATVRVDPRCRVVVLPNGA
jgi:hypothetical protein